MYISKRRKNNLTEQITTVLNGNRVTRGMAAKLGGKVGIATSLGCGEIGRGALLPLTSRKYAVGFTDIDNEVAICLKWRIGFLQ